MELEPQAEAVLDRIKARDAKRMGKELLVENSVDTSFTFRDLRNQLNEAGPGFKICLGCFADNLGGLSQANDVDALTLKREVGVRVGGISMCQRKHKFMSGSGAGYSKCKDAFEFIRDKAAHVALPSPPKDDNNEEFLTWAEGGESPTSCPHNHTCTPAPRAHNPTAPSRSPCAVPLFPVDNSHVLNPNMVESSIISADVRHKTPQMKLEEMIQTRFKVMGEKNDLYKIPMGNNESVYLSEDQARQVLTWDQMADFAVKITHTVSDPAAAPTRRLA